MTHNDPPDLSTSTEAPEQPVTGSGDERTSETASEAFLASALAAWHVARDREQRTPSSAMRAAVAAAAPYYVQAATRVERIRAADLVRTANLHADCGASVRDDEVESLARLIEGDARLDNREETTRDR